MCITLCGFIRMFTGFLTLVATAVWIFATRPYSTTEHSRTLALTFFATLLPQRSE